MAGYLGKAILARYGQGSRVKQQATDNKGEHGVTEKTEDMENESWILNGIR